MNAPKLRFKEFNDEWKKINLSEISSKITKGTTPKKYDTSGINFIKVENIHNNSITNINSYISKNIHEEDLKRSILQENDILFSIAGALGRTAIIKKAILPANTNQACAIIRLDNPNSINLNYFINRLNNIDIQNYIFKCQSVGAQPNLSLEQVSNICIAVPSIQEQIKIGKFLSLLDKEIELQSKKIEALKLYKKGLNNIIFQFEGEEKLIKDVIIEYNKRTSQNNQFEVLSSTMNGIAIQNSYFNKKQASEDTTGYKIVPNGYITYRSMSDTGEFHFNIQNITEVGIVSPAYPVFITTEEVDKIYFLNYINKNTNFKNSILENKEGGTRYALSFSKFKCLKIYLPNLEIQKYFGGMISTINKKIIFEAKKLSKLESLKKGLMQNMFV